MGEPLKKLQASNEYSNVCNNLSNDNGDDNRAEETVKETHLNPHECKKLGSAIQRNINIYDCSGLVTRLLPKQPPTSSPFEEDQNMAARLATTMFSSLKGRPIQGYAYCGKEPLQFVAILQPVVVLKLVDLLQSEIENCFKLSPGCYKLTFKHRSKLAGSVSPDPDEVACNELGWYDGADLYEAASDEDFYASDEDASDEDASDEAACNVFVEGACDENSMEQVSVPLSEKTIIHPFTKERLPFTEETILSLNNGTMGFEEAGALLNGNFLSN
ncbi:villin 3 [Artemisia annua]|uniref:Villin 3 n=1 Tax=Artemisia annua TaxID=35608 RepID=A0A2U1MYT8_ARTAN|nr:villin 3 [Artemisia annua]